MLTLLKVSGESPISSIKPESEKGPVGEQAGPSQEPRVASIAGFQPFNYPNGIATRGYDVYGKNCKACHGHLAKGEYGPKLQENPVLENNDTFWKTVMKGRGNMPAWEERLSVQQIADVRAYLKTLKPALPP